ncbi:hypothetical protein [Desulfosporosinus fructosivorans]|uniref:hypothetical protein n=1 Tax=Desulfosporosinus fructosivorans TaxID=2018669 RepID=UPI00130E114F|nr:hypothetical protein [Desulfosporosinus fructosivorans]
MPKDGWRENGDTLEYVCKCGKVIYSGDKKMLKVIKLTNYNFTCECGEKHIINS